MLKETKELLTIVANQKNGPIPAWLPKDAMKRLEGSQPNTDRAEAIINQLKSGEKHPALGDKIRKAEKELTEFNEQHQGQRRGVRI
ncbi:hypothetical protein OD776_28380 [Pseudomonas aeruginosa]|uniref:hypothetical protein n=1 Tax=Pseudomonas aeruginosa TaxID=287 RepID=UPI0021F22809|nr:hypothetical protein [Pseudomonas aeruginosa]MCV4039533.1 hypothetical protein [Pseudomonas aeruginosa]